MSARKRTATSPQSANAARHALVEGRTALVTGANRGIGFEVCRQLGALGVRIVVGARDAELGAAAADALSREGIDALALPLDIARDESVVDAARALRSMARDVDILVNNAGVYGDAGALASPDAEWRATLETNLFGALRTAKAFMPSMLERGWGRIVNVSSGYGSFGEGLGGPAPYSVSKAALNALTVKLAQDAAAHAGASRAPRGAPAARAPSSVKVNACCPGWVRTRMGGPGASRDVATGAAGVVWCATLPDDGPSGGFFRDGRAIDW